MLRQSPSWQAVSANIHPGARNFMSNQQCLGDQLAQLGRDASAAVKGPRLVNKTTEIKIPGNIRGLLVVLQHRRRVLWRSNRLVGVAAKTESRVKKYFRLEFVAKEQEHTDEDLDIKALEDGFVSVTPLSLLPKLDSDTQATQILVSICVKRHLNL
ncbi:hypothetical protein Bca52824_015017 [Brassica carinata]|uniref:Uncharacterized protein n=1 Tax=Brassica carinata TaxID=52824 RepID=A0A8X8B2T7_BRACI|nr:hypothetical protein Bca52824_015017 [Brassica carinata]